VVGRPGRFVSVQVKSTTAESGGGYACAIRKQNQGYARGSFDFVAAYVVQEDVWYILPASAIRGKESVGLCSNSTQAKYEAYREAWQLLREASEGSSEVSGDGETGGEASSAIECVTSRSVGALGRLEAAMNYFKQHLERSNVDPRKRG
jgi:hypothetical protein